MIGAPHGVKGEVRIKSFTEQPAALAGYGPLRSEDGRIAFTIRSARPLKDDMLVARIEGVGTREAAAALTGTRLVLDRAQLPPTEDEEFYHADLLGLGAETEDGTPVGTVSAVLNYGAGDLLEIGTPTGDSLLVAFTRGFVPVVDLTRGRLVLTEAALASAAEGPEEPEDRPGAA